MFNCGYVPKREGEYVITVLYESLQAEYSPFRVSIGPTETTEILTFGPGISGQVGGIAGNRCAFTIDPKNLEVEIDVAIEGPSDCEPVVKKKSDGAYDVFYFPKESGIYFNFVSTAC